MITMVDMGVGNLDSVRRAFARVGAEIKVTNDQHLIRQSDSLILPGVGAFGDGMAGLRARNLVDTIRRLALLEKKPLLGICLGMQLLADESCEHGRHQGLSLIPGKIVRLDPQSDAYRVPNMGWCDVQFRNPASAPDRVSQGESFYFAHSYHFQCESENDIAAAIQYDRQSITVAVHRDNLYGVQFHPEKSQDAGLAILESFLKVTRTDRAAIKVA